MIGTKKGSALKNFMHNAQNKLKTTHFINNELYKIPLYFIKVKK